MKDNIFLKYSAAAFDLCNDHRDTLLYTGLAVGQISDLVCNWNLPNGLFVQAACTRELLRTASWIAELAMGKCSVAGKGNSPKIDSLKYFWSAATMFNLANVTLDAIFTAADPNYLTTDPLVRVDLMFVPINLYLAGGPKNIIKCYKDVMWDFPRKNKPPGGGNPLVEKFGEFSKWIARPFQPATPAPSGASRVLISAPLNRPSLAA